MARGGQGTGSISFPRGAVIRTMLKDLPQELKGPTLSHEPFR